MSATESWPRRPRSTVGALEVVVVGGGVDVALVAQVLDRVVHVVAAHATSDLDENNRQRKTNLYFQKMETLPLLDLQSLTE